MDRQRYVDLLQQLHAKTAAGQANWAPTSRDNEFVLQLRAVSVSMRDSDFVSGIQFVVRNADGRPVDHFEIGGQDPDYQVATDLFQTARRRALRADEALESLLNELRGSGVVGEPSGKK